MMNTAQNVYYTQRNPNGSWTNWSPVGINVGAVSISATTIGNKPNVSLLNTAGNVYINTQSSLDRGWVGLPWGPGRDQATPAIVSSAIVADFNNYEFAFNDTGTPLFHLRHLRALEHLVRRGTAAHGSVSFRFLDDRCAILYTVCLRDWHRRQRVLERSVELGDLEPVYEYRRPGLSKRRRTGELLCWGLPRKSFLGSGYDLSGRWHGGALQ